MFLAARSASRRACDDAADVAMISHLRRERVVANA
jgi:hypothetical protein